jgi:uncharacterized damage-inducible protein DinB
MAVAILDDLIRHQEWADASHWHALRDHPAALADAAVRDRLHHIHMVQHAFLWMLGVSEFARTTPSDFADADALLAYARQHHGAYSAIRARLADETWLAATLSPPWFKDPPLTLNRREALTQVVMHSQWHRGQNAARLRELGGDVPGTDYIVWLWKGRPEPRWD